MIEELLAKNVEEYGTKPWEHCGAERGGYYPVIGFINERDSKVVSLKTVDLNAASYQGNAGTRQVIKLINEYAKKKLPVEGEYFRILDVRVPDGTKVNLNMDEINKAAEAVGIRIEVEEF